jgi:putative ABC transport system permease protein
MPAVLRLSLWGLRRRVGRSLLTATIVIIASAFVCAWISLDAAVKEKFLIAMADHTVLVSPRMQSSSLTQVMADRISKMPGVLDTVNKIFLHANDKSSGRVLVVVGCSANVFDWDYNERYFWAPPAMVEAWKNDRTGVIVGLETAAYMGWKAGDHVQLETAQGPLQLHITGISMKGENRTRIAAHVEYLDQFLGGKGTVDNVLAKVQDDAVAAALLDKVDGEFENSAAPTMSVSEADALAREMTRSMALPNLLGMVGWMFLALTLVIVGNTVRGMVAERTTEIATLRAIGYRRATIALLTVLEPALVCGSGGVIGAVLPAVAFSHGLSAGRQLAGVAIGPSAILAGCVAGIIVGVLAGLLPAIHASRANVLEGLRQA